MTPDINVCEGTFMLTNYAKIFSARKDGIVSVHMAIKVKYCFTIKCYLLFGPQCLRQYVQFVQIWQHIMCICFWSSVKVWIFGYDLGTFRGMCHGSPHSYLFILFPNCICLVDFSGLTKIDTCITAMFTSLCHGAFGILFLIINHRVCLHKFIVDPEPLKIRDYPI